MRLIRIFSKKQILLLIIILSILSVKCGEDHKFQNNNSNEISKIELENLKSKKSFYDLFRFEKIITLNENQNFPIGNVSEIQCDSIGNLYILDRIGNQILIFDYDGHFIRKIGEYGYGPEEYASAKVMYYRNKSIYIADIKRKLIHHYTNENKYIKSFKLAAWNCYKLFVNKYEDKFYIYDPIVTDALRQKQIIIQDNKGKIIEKFCEPSILAQKHFACPNYAFEVNEKNSEIFQVNSHEYKVNCYDENGKILHIINNEEGISECKSLPSNFQIYRDFSDKYQKKFRKSFNWISKMYIVKNKFLIIVYLVSNKPNPIIYQMDLLSLKGDFINCNIKLPSTIKGVFGKYIFTVKEREMKEDGELTPLNINVWELN